MKAHKLPKLSVKEYINYEMEHDLKCEFHDGEIFALAGGTINHGVLCGNIYSELGKALRAKESDCNSYSSEIKLFIESVKSFLYPDSMVICGDVKESSKDKNAVVNPILISEVLSKSTSDYDRGDKFYKYRQIPTLQEYVLIHQDKMVVEIFFKQPSSDLWKISRYEGESEIIYFESIDVKVKMTDLFYNTRLD